MIRQLKFRSGIESLPFQTANPDILMQMLPLSQIGISGRCYYSFTSPGGRWIITRGGVISVYTDRVAGGGGGGGGGGGLLAIWVPRWRWSRASVISNVTCGRRWRWCGRRWAGCQGNSFQWDGRNNTDFRGLCTQRLIKTAEKITDECSSDKYYRENEKFDCHVISVRPTRVDPCVHGGAVHIFLTDTLLQCVTYQFGSLTWRLRCVQRYALLMVIVPLTGKRNKVVVIAPCGLYAIYPTHNDKDGCDQKANQEGITPEARMVAVQVLGHESHNANYGNQQGQGDLKSRGHLFASFNFMEVKLFVKIKSSLFIHGVSRRTHAEEGRSLGNGGWEFLDGIIT